MWSWSPATVTPDGGGISSGTILTADILGIGVGLGYATPSCIFQAVASASNTSFGSVDTYGYGLRDCIGVGTSSGLCDVGNSLSVNGTRNVNTLDFIGDSVIVVNNTATITDDAGMTYATRVDQINTLLMYKAEAVPGSSESAAVWRVSKLVFGSDGDVTVTWAGGSDSFTNKWSDRLTLVYS